LRSDGREREEVRVLYVAGTSWLRRKSGETQKELLGASDSGKRGTLVPR
jgi:hypothetical protein